MPSFMESQSRRAVGEVNVNTLAMGSWPGFCATKTLIMTLGFAAGVACRSSVLE